MNNDENNPVVKLDRQLARQGKRLREIAFVDSTGASFRACRAALAMVLRRAEAAS